MRGVGAGDNMFRCFKWKEDSYNILHFFFFFSLSRFTQDGQQGPQSPDRESGQDRSPRGPRSVRGEISHDAPGSLGLLFVRGSVIEGLEETKQALL